ncbi:hypothetical protein BGZ54_005568 [Gamsiella multidivaricata]|nr:hypothetical protein BGZ54_005568 [Gamsiella multidivaricata]
MESLNKKSTPISFAAVAGKAPASAVAPSAAAAAAASGGASAGGPSGAGAASKNGSSAPSNQSSVTQGSQSAAPGSASGADKAGTSGSASGSASSGSIDWIVGLHVKVVTQADEIFEGQIYAYDVTMNCLCPSVQTVPATTTPAVYYSPSLGNAGSAPRLKYDFRILKINYIKEVTPLPSESTSASGGAVNPAEATDTDKGTKEEDKSNTNSARANSVYATALPAVGFVHLDKIQQREQQAIREAQAAAARIGVGVSSIGQDIFDALSKTLPCRWAKDSIVVMDEVIIAPPYEPENCKANASSSYTLARVKKVLEGERMRLANGRK